MAPKLSWNSLHPELRARVLAYLDDEERCRVIPLLSRESLALHNDYPPQRKSFMVQTPIPLPVARWFKKIAPTIETMEIVVNMLEYEPMCLLPCLLTSAAVSARLAELDLTCNGDVFRCLPFLASLTQLKMLRLRRLQRRCNYPARNAWRSLSGLQSLEEIAFEDLKVASDVDGQGIGTAALSAGLAQLRHLRSVEIGFSSSTAAGGGRNALAADLVQSLSVLTQLSALQLLGAESCLDGAGSVPHGLSTLTLLTSLTVHVCGEPLVRGPSLITGLPRLPSLAAISLRSARWSTRPAASSFPFHTSAYPKLTKICILNGPASSAGEVLPHGMPGLRHLELSGAYLHCFPAALACTLSSLEVLDLSDSVFGCIPQELAVITTLRTLKMCSNARFGLYKRDLLTLAALPNLTALCITQHNRYKCSDCESRVGLPQESLGMIVAIARQFPGLHFIV